MKATVEGVVLIPIGREGQGLHRGMDDQIREALLTFSVLDDSWVVRFHDSNARVGGSEIDADDATVSYGIRCSRCLTQSFSGQSG